MNCEVAEINGHNHKKISDTLKKKRKKPLIVVCNTIKGKGVKLWKTITIGIIDLLLRKI